MKFRQTIVLPPRPFLGPALPAEACCAPSGPYLVMERYWALSEHNVMIVGLHCLSTDDLLDWRNPGGLPEGTAILNAGGITTAEHALLISSIGSTGVVIRIGATVNGRDLGTLEITLP